ncbi:DNA mismatch repair endonuclease MutH [Gayadomonas joobiniege]|uniref:DNA mismatch repair endonuclease MutH n=1 Tax=Gayadomonas joobiniege TaxID=1234606 RepID=UPI00035E6DFD|nr:DNA mismatch repair endonuclease MutH [Gayadomonas joobiniege]
MIKPKTPASEQELLALASQIAGFTLSDLAQLAGIQVPENLRKDKGWGGQLIEWHLGASAGSKPVPDFEQLGIELKSLPVNRNGEPLETTFVCAAQLTGIAGQTWLQSPVYKKLARVLWIPILAERSIPVKDRLVGYPILWSPTAQQAAALRADWEEIMDKIAFGEIQSITAKTGTFLQLRPKAAHSRIRTQAIGTAGEPIAALPRGFYLKKDFTRLILNSV